MEHSNVRLTQLGKHELQLVSKQLVKGKLLEHFKDEIVNLQEGDLRSPMTVQIGKREITIQVKSKRQDFWPKVKGITGNNVFIVFVDYAGKQNSEEADFYIVNPKDFRVVMEMRISELRKKNKRARIDETNTLIFEDRNRVGTNVSVDHLISFKNDWGKLNQGAHTV
ncbi:MAG: hypothetical protein AB1724_15260 [Thermodesulfobacteriota bacterium]